MRGSRSATLPPTPTTRGTTTRIPAPYPVGQNGDHTQRMSHRGRHATACGTTLTFVYCQSLRIAHTSEGLKVAS
jgi:hypothetical protein